MVIKNAILLIATMMAIPSLADTYDFESGGLYYRIIAEATNEVAVTDPPYGSDYTGDITVPATVTNSGTQYTVTTLDAGVFANFEELTKLTISEGITTIESSLCAGSAALTEVSIPESATDINTSYMFQCCTALTKVTLPSSITSYGSNMFVECTSLTSFEIPSNITEIGSQAFSSSGLTSVTIPSSVTSISGYAFYDCVGIKTATIAGTDLTIGENAFAITGSVEDGEVTTLETLTILPGVVEIGQYAFQYCKNLKTMTLPSTLTSIGMGAFYGCKSLESITCYATTPPTISENVSSYSYTVNNGEIVTATFMEVLADCPVYVPSESTSDYSTANCWKDFTTFTAVTTTEEQGTGTAIAAMASADGSAVVAVYNILGARTDALQRGVNIVKYADGTIKKVMVK